MGTSQHQPLDAPPLQGESTLYTWRRRALSVPGLIGLTHTAVGLTPGALALALLRDLARGDARISTTRGWLALVGNLVVHEVGLAQLAWAGIRHRGDSPAAMNRRGEASYDVERKLAEALMSILETLYGLKMEIEGLDDVGPDPNLIFARHCSLLDPVMLMAVTAPRGVRLRYVCKRELLWDPCIDVLGHRFPMAFVTRQGRAHDDDVAAVEHLSDHLHDHEAVLAFPEGTRFSPEKKARAIHRLGLQHPALAARASKWNHLLPPHVGGVLSLLAHDQHDHVVICAHTGLEGISHAVDILDGALDRRTLRLKFWRVDRRDIPAEPDRQVEWLYAVFDEIEAFVEDNV